MTFTEESVLRGSLRIILYDAMERFILEHVVPEIEKTFVKADKEALLIKAEVIADRAVSRAIQEIEKNNFNSLEQLEDDPDLVDSLMTNIQKDMIADAESIQEN